MYAIGHEPAPIEKIRKAQWTVENTRKTQAVVDELDRCRGALRMLAGTDNRIAWAIERAITRFTELDGNVKQPI